MQSWPKIGTTIKITPVIDTVTDVLVASTMTTVSADSKIDGGVF